MVTFEECTKLLLEWKNAIEMINCADVANMRTFSTLRSCFQMGN